MRATKPRVLIHGNCQSEWLGDTLARDARLTEHFEIVHIPGNYQNDKAALLKQPEFLASCAFVAWQTAAGCRPPEFVAALPASCRQIRYPSLCLKMLWPLHAVDPRSQPEPGYPNGRYPYGDRLLMKLRSDGVSLEDLPKRYIETDLNTIVNLDRFGQMSLAELRINDRQSDIPMATLVENSFRTRRTFAAINHPTLLLLHHIAETIVAILLNRPLPSALANFVDGDEILGDQEIPIHPQVAAHFGLTWLASDRKWEYGAALHTLEEYVRAYATYTPVPFGIIAQSWMTRAQRALARRNVHGVRSIVLQAMHVFPQLPEFPRFLATTLAQNGNMIESARILCDAVARMPGNADLRCALGGALLHLQLPAEARQMFQEALRIDPNHREARRQSILAAARSKSLPPALRPSVA